MSFVEWQGGVHYEEETSGYGCEKVWIPPYLDLGILKPKNIGLFFDILKSKNQYGIQISEF